MPDFEFYIVEMLAESYHNEPTDTNEHQLGLPIVDGPYDTRDEAEEQNASVPDSKDGYEVVPVPSGYVPSDWRDDD